MTYTYHSRGETYSVDDAGNIGRPELNMAPSGGWKLRGFVRFNNFGHEVEFVPFPQCFTIPGSALRHKNGKPRYFVADIDHGTSRVQMAGITWAAKEVQS